jgi:RNA recognition motif-containing protein
MPSKLFVGNLSLNILENEVLNLFSKAGKVTSVNLLQDRSTGKGRGFGFIAMSTDEETSKAVSMFNGKEFQGRALKVNEARSRAERSAPLKNENRPAASRGYPRRRSE